MKTTKMGLLTLQYTFSRTGVKKFLLLCFVLMFISPLMYGQQTVILYGTCADTSITRIRYSKVNSFRWSEINSDHFINVSRKNNHFEIKLQVNNPQTLNIIPPGYSWIQTTYITPGDSVSFQIIPTSKKKQYEIVFSGKDAAQYNYPLFMRKAFYRQKPWFKKGTDLSQYKQALLSYKKRQMDSLRNYVGHHVVSKDFVKYAKAEIENNYIVSLYSPMEHKLVSKQDLPAGYLQDSNPLKNQVSYQYKVALAEKNIYNYTDSPTTHFNAVYTNIVQNFSGQDKAFLLSAMIGYYALKQKTEYQSGLLRAIKEAPKYVHNAQYLNYIRKADKYYTLINHPFPDSVLTCTYLRSYSGNEKITLKELLNRYKGKALFLDFWASWCTPCRYDIAHSHLAKQYLAKKNVAYIYISRDTDVKAWLKASKEDNITQNQYLLYTVPDAPLLKFLKIIYIPRYVLMDGQHDIKEPTAPRPAIYNGNTSNFEQLKRSIQKITGERKIVTFK